jgi:hypothetical protein
MIFDYMALAWFFGFVEELRAGRSTTAVASLVIGIGCLYSEQVA